MTATRISRKIKVLGLPLGLTGAAAAALLASGTMSTTAVARSSADQSMAEAQKALGKGKVEKAIELAEAAVAGNPREPSYRAVLGQAYLKAGRFESAATTFDDAMKLGDNSSRTALGLALANVAAGRNRQAVAILDDWRDAIPGTDLGLALALAGETSRGVAILVDQMRSGEDGPKVRQNLAYAYALDGRWREARLIAAQDVPADQLDARISEWAMTAKPEDARLRVAGLIKAPNRAADPGQPVALALGSSPVQEQLAAESGAIQAVAVKDELPAAGAVNAQAEPVDSLAHYAPVGAAPAAEASTPLAPQSFASAFSSTPVIQPVAETLAPTATPRAVRPTRVAASIKHSHRAGLRPRTASAKAKGTHLVQLGSFSSEQGARRAWGIYAARNPELRSYHMTITQATVRGKQYWRVAAGGLNSGSASGLCSTVKTRGGACFAYAANRFGPGAKSLTAPALAAAKPAKAVAVAGPAKARR